ncbi:hypothetical protein POKO110462_05045 [Pontibacter korlensis]|uniref:Lipoprotein n=1 Tax=Pontibacter korlensis TaxID=400092 RepID=A0A0E3ZDI7_9BACT|nr:hypothetical protein [Pontibacter korlensis]AKD03113.1 hypothetical protein PKOR_08250 [Pontibacter korlensis]
MNKSKLRSTLFAMVATVMATFSIAACNTGTDPGDTDTERGDIKRPGSMVNQDEDDQVQAERDSMEQHYDHADHEKHDDNRKGSAVHAGDGKKDAADRGENNQ